jgi:hypothetical protein
MRKSLSAFLMVGVLALIAVGCSDDDELEMFSADLSGANEVPPATTLASGRATLTLEGDTVSFSVEVDDITAATMAHIHSGALGVNGPVRVFLFGPGGNFTTTGRAVLAQGSFTAADVAGISFEELLAELRAGTAYVNVHTTLYPGGEIRGQTRLEN